MQKTISTLLAAQLLFSFGLCGGLCCVKLAELSDQQTVAKAAESEENLPPCHRKKETDKATAKQDHETHSARQTQPPHQKSGSGIAASILHRNCCVMKRETPEGESPLSIFSPQSSKLVATFEALPWNGDEIAFGLPQIPIQISATHSPPHTGFQLSLRI